MNRKKLASMPTYMKFRLGILAFLIAGFLFYALGYLCANHIWPTAQMSVSDMDTLNRRLTFLKLLDRSLPFFNRISFSLMLVYASICKRITIKTEGLILLAEVLVIGVVTAVTALADPAFAGNYQWAALQKCVDAGSLFVLAAIGCWAHKKWDF